MIYSLKDLSKTRFSAGVDFRLVLPELKISPGEKVALVGISGCGKSTLLDILSMVLNPDKPGDFHFSPGKDNSVDVADLWRKSDFNRLSLLRRQYMGYILQTGGLLPFLSVHDNINLTRRLLALPEDKTVTYLAQELGIKRQLRKEPGLLSVGERQRVAIARALAHKPSVVIADEPTASLDPINADKIMRMLIELTEQFGSTVIIASHDWAFVEKLKLRCLRAELVQKEDGITESIFTG